MTFSLSQEALSRLMPMHLVLDPAGRIIGHGPTIAKVFADRGLTPAQFFDHFEVRRPSGITGAQDLDAIAGERVQIALKTGGAVTLRGLCQRLDGGQGYLVNLSFGIDVVEAVRDLALSEADFAPTDLAIEMLYLVEAKSAVMRELRDLNERLHDAKVMAEQQAQTDTLTGLRNRRALTAEMARLIARGAPFALMHLDLDYFKQVNDTLGHAAGDHVLRRVAEVLIAETRASDIVARVGGDEFVIVLSRVDGFDPLLPIAGRIIAALGVPIPFEGQMCRISGSIGITLSAEYPDPDIEVMHADADAALYDSKRAGRARATVYHPSLPAAQRA